MTTDHLARIRLLQERLKDQRIDGAVLTDPDSIFWYSGYWGYASLISCGRPNILWIPASDDPEIITPSMELEMCQNLAPIGRIHGWVDGVDGEWMKPFGDTLRKPGIKRIGIEADRTPAVVLNVLRRSHDYLNLIDVGAVTSAMRMIKSPGEITVMRQAGEVAIAMVEAGRAMIEVGTPEYEISLAVLMAGTRKAAQFLNGAEVEPFFSPMIHNLQIMQSGHHTCMVHRRPTVRRIQRGDPVYLCFCGITVFKGYWLGFDREFFVGSVTDEQARLYEVTIRAQQAALETIRPGVHAEDVHRAANEVYLQAGFPPTYRTGRGTGASILERPELKAGDRTILQPGMTFAVDGGLTLPSRFGARVGDSVVVTPSGYEALTPYPKGLTIV